MGECPFGEGELGPYLTQCGQGRTLPVCQVIFIHPTVWSQYTNVTNRQTGQDRQTGKRSDSMGRTVLQTVAQKSDLNFPDESRITQDTKIAH